MKTINKIAKDFNFPVRAVRRWVATGVIPSIKSGNRVYIDPAWISAKLEKDGTLERSENNAS